MRKILTYLLCIFCIQMYVESVAQDTIIVYDVPSQSLNEILPVSFDTSQIFQHSSYSSGSLGNTVPLNLLPPTSNLFTGSLFSDIERAGLFFNVSDYPVRTAVNLFGWNNDTMKQTCSGILVGENFVLTAAHCVLQLYSQNWLYDSIFVVPAFDNAEPQTAVAGSIVEKYYVFKSYYDNSGFDDIALLQLREPIGKQIGWIGMAYSSNPAYFSNKVFHKLSYPGIPSPYNPSILYNGDTLYYNYGEIDMFGSFLGVNSSQANGIPGQSGSSLFFTDNTAYYSFGVMSYSTQYTHYQITNRVFSQLKNIIDNNPSGLNQQFDDVSLCIYPNPFSDYTFVEIDNAAHSDYAIRLFNISGQLMRSLDNINTGKLKIDRGDLTSGMYFVQLLHKGKTLARSKLLIK